MAKILIADDSAAIRLVLKDILSIGNHEIVAEATNGAEAVVLYQQHNPQLLLLDLAMPKKDGLTVVKEVMKYDVNAKIILISASEDHKIINQCLEYGAKSHIKKPFDFNSVLKSITAILEN